MVDKVTVIASNDEFAQRHRKGCVAVFMGATAGIGESTLNRLVALLDDSTFYVLGRNPQDIASKLDLLSSTASKRGNKIVFIESQASLISDIDAASDRIMAAETQVDYLCMSPGGMPFGGAVYTKEGIETCFAVSYYSRLRLVSNLFPILRRAHYPRVLSILNGTLEKAIDEDDLGLDKRWGITAVVNHTTVCTSLAFDFLSQNDTGKKIVFLHATPGFVSTDTPRKTRPSMEHGAIWWAFVSTMQVISGWIIYYFGMNVVESGERHCYHLTSDTYKPGSWQVDRHDVVQPPNKVLKGYQDRGLAEKVWEHSLQVWDKALTSNGSASM